eukprot:6211310-Pleurochrysis_carterae.AAC.1
MLRDVPADACSNAYAITCATLCAQCLCRLDIVSGKACEMSSCLIDFVSAARLPDMTLDRSRLLGSGALLSISITLIYHLRCPIEKRG